MMALIDSIPVSHDDLKKRGHDRAMEAPPGGNLLPAWTAVLILACAVAAAIGLYLLLNRP